ncbi:hypothetical protein J4221_03125 [Candidatus Pacearchaeota archaeon]|nr:hypothetical protein [Candidatus Pacearchaeota archaeon]
MNGKGEDKRAKLIGVYAKVPDSLRDDIVVIVDKEPYTWTTAYLEVKGDTELGKKILKALEDIGII